jgi:hypothetical protein
MSHVPDRVEMRIRFGCGFIFGAIAAAIIGMRVITGWSIEFGLGVALVASLTGLLARRHGDDFWKSLFWWLP